MIELDGLTKYYGSLAALRQVTASVGPGSVGLLGPNGAGKSTLIRTLLGLLDYRSGSARVLGHDIRDEVLALRQRIGYMPEQETYFPGMTGLEMTAYAGELSGMGRADATSRAHEILDYVGLGEARYRPVETYSTGMKQRAKLAQALVHGPELVFLDEPTNGLDPMGREEMLSIVSDLSKAAVNVVLSSHLLRDVERVCDSLLLMDRGRILHYGSLEDFTRATRRQFEVRVRGGDGARAFIERVRAAGLAVVEPERSDRPIVVEAALPASADGQEGSTPADEAEVAGTLVEAAVAGGCEIRHLAPVTMSLETAFLRFLEAGEAGRTGEGPEASTAPSDAGGAGP
jgi:ABC-2 type transport system ATP-binding protein